MARGYWIQMHCDLERLGIVEDLSRLCPQSVTEVSPPIPVGVTNRSQKSTSDDYVPVIPRDRCTMIGALHVVWSRFYEQGERVEGTGDIRLREHPGKLDEITGVAGFARALASVGWLRIEGPKSIVAPRLRKKFGEVVEANAVDRVEARARRKAKGNADAGNDDHQPSPIAGVPDSSPKCPRNVPSTEQNRTEQEKTEHGGGSDATPPVFEFTNGNARSRGITLDGWLEIWHGRGRMSPAFVAAATAFYEAREQGGKPITKAGAAALVTPCEGFTDDEVIADMQRCVAGGFVRLEPRKQAALGPTAGAVVPKAQAALEAYMRKVRGQ
jgi:hypothetical protein